MQGHRRPCGGLLALLLLAAASWAQDDSPGWHVRAFDPDGRERRMALEAETANFRLGAGQTYHPAFHDGDSLAFQGSVLARRSGRYRFGLDLAGAEGSLRVGDVVVEGETLTDWLELPAGSLDLRATVRRTGEDFGLRVLWERANDDRGGFPLEPIPARAVSAPGGVVPQGEANHRGRVLIESKGCVNCHAPTWGPASLAGRTAPVLDGIGSRASTTWLERWLRDPAAVRPGADMPAVFGAGEGEELAAVVAYLTSLEDPDLGPAPALATEPAVLAEGRSLYHSLGCVACHGALASPAELFDDDFRSAEVPEAAVLHPFGDLAGKWHPRALRDFLMDPHATHPDGRMPSFGLDGARADALATYLATEFGGTFERATPDPDRVAWGRSLLSRKGCLACHELGGERLPAAARPLATLEYRTPDRGCLRAAAEDDTPKYDLSGAELEDLYVAIPRSASGNGAHAPLEAARRRLDGLGCLECHPKSGAGGVLPELDGYFASADERVDLGDEGRLPPDLSGVGWRLTTRWLDTILTGDERSRPYLAVQMPRYHGDHVGDLAEMLALADGVAPHADVPEPEVTDAMVLAGRDMMGRDALGCLACHVHGDTAPTGSPGLAITQFGERLRYEWFRSFMQSPQRYRPGSRMPDFGTGGKSTLAGVYDGDMLAQADAMWAYFSLGEFMPLPDELAEAKSDGLRLVVGTEPIIHRGFLPEVGTRGIAVGLPVGIHYAFDAENCRLAQVWQGDFLSASGSWAGRGGNQLGERGPLLWESPDGAMRFVDAETGETLPEEAARPRFLGYRLDGSGYPTFEYELYGVHIEESIRATVTPRRLLRRALRLHDPGSAVRVFIDGMPEWVRDAGGMQLTSNGILPTRGIDLETEVSLQ